jgi:hypothetical protein
VTDTAGKGSDMDEWNEYAVAAIMRCVKIYGHDETLLRLCVEEIVSAVSTLGGQYADDWDEARDKISSYLP